MKKSSIALFITTIFFGLLLIGESVAQTSSGQKLPEAPAPKTQSASPAAAQPAPASKEQKQKISYAIGMYFGRSLMNQTLDLNQVDPDVVLQGLKDVMSGAKTQMTEDEQHTVLMQLQTDVRAKQEEKRKLEADKNKKEGDAFLTANKTKDGVITLPSGLQYKVLTQGTGAKPVA